MEKELINREQLRKSRELKRQPTELLIERRKLKINSYDIRVERDIEVMRKSIEQEGMLQPLTVNIRENDDYVVIDGKTRFLASDGLVDPIRCVVYKYLSGFEEDYLNANINSHQKQLTPNEKREFIKRHKDIMSTDALCDALNLTEPQVEDIKISTEVPDEIANLFRNKDDGYGRGEIEIQAIAQAAEPLKNLTEDVKESALRVMGSWHQETEMTDRNKRATRKKIARTAAEWLENPTLTKKYTTEEIVTKVIAKVEDSNCTGDFIPKGSEKKPDFFKDIVDAYKYDFAVVLMSEGLKRKTSIEGVEVDSESKILVDSPIKDITLVSLDLDKIEEVAEYGKTVWKNVKIHCENVLDYIQNIEVDKRLGLIYVNGDTFWAQRPYLVNLLHMFYPNSIISIIYIDYIFLGKHSTSDEDQKKELATVYGLRRSHSTFTDLQSAFTSQILFAKYVEWIQYGSLPESPQNKYIVKITPS